MKNINSKKDGFTLIELMVVIAIIGILTAIVTANFTQSKAKARDAKRVSDLAQIQLTLELAFDRCNVYPPNINSETTVINSNCKDSSNNAYTLSYFISKIPKESATVDYDYAVNSSGTDYVLGAKLETKSTSLDDAIPTFPTSIGATDNKFSSGNDCTHSTVGGPYYYCVVPK